MGRCDNLYSNFEHEFVDVTHKQQYKREAMSIYKCYFLSELGESMRPILYAMKEWGENYKANYFR